MTINPIKDIYSIYANSNATSNNQSVVQPSLDFVPSLLSIQPPSHCPEAITIAAINKHQIEQMGYFCTSCGESEILEDQITPSVSQNIPSLCSSCLEAPLLSDRVNSKILQNNSLPNLYSSTSLEKALPQEGYRTDAPTKLMKRNKLSKTRGRPTVAKSSHCQSCNVQIKKDWRTGPAGYNTLCNACGLKWKKTVNKQRSEKSMNFRIA